MSNQTTPKPVFIFGVHRSGTTWLANILCRHSNVAGVQAKEHKGIHESAFFSSVKQHFGDLSKDNNFIEFVETFCSSDYFQLTSLDKSLFYNSRPKDYCSFFRLLMNKFAEKQGADFWVEKTPAHTLYLDRIEDCFEDAYFIGIKRNVIDTVRSSIKRNSFESEWGRKVQILKSVTHYQKYMKFINNFNKKENCKIIEFENLKKNKENITRNLCSVLGLEWEKSMLEREFEPNTSFDDIKERKKVLSSSEENLVRLFNQILSGLPFIFFQKVQKIEDYSNKNDLPEWFWKIYKKEKLLK